MIAGITGMKPGRPTLVIVDDEVEILHSLFNSFRTQYNVIRCASGAEALEVLQARSDVAVIMTDQKMAGMTGVQVLSEAKRIRPEATRLLITAHSDIKDVIDAINQGSVYRYIAKPWDPDELQAILRQAVEQHDLVVDRDRLMDELQMTNQRLLDANRLKGAFIEVASHELNTPVALIHGMTELWKMARNGCAPLNDEHYIDRIQCACKRLAGMVERMLKLSKTNELDLTLDLHDVDLADVLHAAVHEFHPFLEVRRQAVELDIDPDLGRAVVDPSKLADILANLIGNAVKFTPDKGTIRISATIVGDDCAQFRVVDQGTGISPTDRKYLFEPFFTGFDTMHHSSGEYQYRKRGIGLGLCLVKTFVELHGGSVDVETAPGQGSIFSFTLPRHLRRPPEHGAAAVLAGSH